MYIIPPIASKNLEIALLLTNPYRPTLPKNSSSFKIFTTKLTLHLIVNTNPALKNGFIVLVISFNFEYLLELRRC